MYTHGGGFWTGGVERRRRQGAPRDGNGTCGNGKWSDGMRLRRGVEEEWRYCVGGGGAVGGSVEEVCELGEPRVARGAARK
jgi:hypothetical protein